MKSRFHTELENFLNTYKLTAPQSQSPEHIFINTLRALAQIPMLSDTSSMRLEIKKHSVSLIPGECNNEETVKFGVWLSKQCSDDFDPINDISKVVSKTPVEPISKFGGYENISLRDFAKLVELFKPAYLRQQNNLLASCLAELVEYQARRARTKRGFLETIANFSFFSSEPIADRHPIIELKIQTGFDRPQIIDRPLTMTDRFNLTRALLRIESDDCAHNPLPSASDELLSSFRTYPILQVEFSNEQLSALRELLCSSEIYTESNFVLVLKNELTVEDARKLLHRSFLNPLHS